jgi:hypothetical protein
MNANNPNPASVRLFNYGFPGIPYAVLDGGAQEQHRYDFLDENEDLEKDLREQSLGMAPFDIELTVEWLENSLEATTTVTCNVDRYDENIQLYVVVMESSVNAYNGINGDNHFRNVVLDMLPTSTGKLLGDGWTKGKTDTRSNTWTYASFVEDVEDLVVVAFIQDRSSGEILHSNVKYADLSVPTYVKNPLQSLMQLYPNPAKSNLFINFGNRTEEDGHLKLIDMNGRVVLSEKLPAGYQIYQLEIGYLQRGVYIVQWEQSGFIKGMEKVIKTE